MDLAEICTESGQCVSHFCGNLRKGRQMSGVKLPDKVTCVDLEERSGVVLQHDRLQQYGHMLRKYDPLEWVMAMSMAICYKSMAVSGLRNVSMSW